MSTYAQQKIHLRTVLDCGGRLVGRPPWPSLRTSPGWGGNCAYVASLLGDIDTPNYCSSVWAV